jgi:hypothetical protein
MLQYLLFGSFILFCLATLCGSTKLGFTASYAAATCFALSGVHMIFIPAWEKVYSMPEKGDPHVFIGAVLINLAVAAGPYGLALFFFLVAWALKFLGDGWAEDYSKGTLKKRQP